MSDWFQAEFHAERAHRFYEAGQWDKALAELKLALSLDPSQSDWHFGMGLTLDALERYDEAVTCFEQVLQLRGDDIDTMLHLGVDLIRSGNDRRAVEVLERVSKIDADNEPAYCHRILAYARLGEHEHAEEMFYLARQVVEECPLCYDHLAHSLAHRDDLDRAIWCWQRVLKMDPHFPEASANLARCHWRKGQHERAHELYIQQLRDDPGDVDTLLQAAQLLAEMGRHAESREKARRVLEIDPTVAAAYHHLGEMSLLAGHLDGASSDLEMAKRLDPDRTGVRLALARVAQLRGKDEEARSLLRAELDLTGHEPMQVLDMARMLIELRMPQPAVELLSPLIEGEQSWLGDDGRASAFLYRGVARLLTRRTDEGVRDCRAALRLAPRNTLAMRNLVVAYLDQGRLSRARYWLSKAVELSPADTQLQRLRYRMWSVSLAKVLRNAQRRLRRWITRRP
ncbi:MAG: tetratricopeptide repeat protein [Planctomycetes bacterium]|nr:tetratricopeptide repeat protein [Planctomycetota bacterium]